MRKTIVIISLLIAGPTVFTMAQERGVSGAEDAELREEVDELKRETEYLKNENERLKEELADESDDLDKRIQDTFKYYALYTGAVALYVSLVLFILGYLARSEIIKRVEELKREYFKRVDIINEIEKGLRETTNDAKKTIKELKGSATREFQHYETKLFELKKYIDQRFEKLTRRYKEVQEQIEKKASKELPPLSKAAFEHKEVERILDKYTMLRDSSEFLYEAAMEGDIIDKATLEKLAENLFYGEDYGEAINIWKLLKKSDPKNPLWDYNIGLALSNSGKYDEALVAYERAIELNPDYADAFNNKGNVLLKLKKLEESLVAYEKAIELQPDLAIAHSNKGIVLSKLGRYDEGLAACERAIELDPDDAYAYNNKGVTLVALRKYEDALVTFDRAIELKPDYANAYSNKGGALNKLERYEEGIAACERAIELKRDFADAFAIKAYALIKQGKYRDAVNTCNKALGINDQLALAYYNRACAYSLLGNKEAMEADLRKAVEFDDKYCEEAKEDPDFDPFREEVDALLKEICPDN